MLDPAPVDRVHAAFDGGADQPADERMPGARRQAEPPGHKIPGRRRQAGANHLNRHVRRDGDDAADRVGDGCAEEQRAEEVEHRREQDRLQRRRGPRGDQRGDRVGCVVEPVRDGEPDREQHRDHKLGLHGRTIRSAARNRCGFRLNGREWAHSSRGVISQMIKKTLAGTAAAVGAAAVLGSVASGRVNSPWYVDLNKPAIQPPGPVFLIVWTLLYSTLRSLPPS